MNLSREVSQHILVASFSEPVPLDIGSGWRVHNGIVWNELDQDEPGTLRIEFMLPLNMSTGTMFDDFVSLVAEHHLAVPNEKGEYRIDRHDLMCDDVVRPFILRRELAIIAHSRQTEQTPPRL